MVISDPYCEHLATPNPWALGLAIFLVVAILLSYLPQHLKIIQNGSSAGLSPWWILLGTLSSIGAITAAIVLPNSQHDMKCCREISGAACGAALLGIIQIGVQWFCFMIITVLFLIFFPRQGLDQPEDEHSPDVPKKGDAIMVGLVSLLVLLLVGIVSTYLLVGNRDYLLTWANILGICAAIMSCIQYLPQLWTTYKIGHVLSLSITSMAIQVPGSFLFAFSLWLRVGWEGWSTWLLYCLTGVLQGSLLGMAVYFSRKDRKSKASGLEPLSDDPSENDPLLPGRSNGHA